MKYFFSATLILFSILVQGQDTIFLKNPSFEATPFRGSLADYFRLPEWLDCGPIYFPDETPPDIHGVDSEIWGVRISPHDGTSCLGMVTRYNNSFESISQPLDLPLKAGHCYAFQLYARQGPQYKSGTRRSSTNPENFNAPTVLRIWGGHQNCERIEKLFESEAMDDQEWKEVNMTLRPLHDLSSISIEVYYQRHQHQFPDAYNGHLLLDQLSAIIEVPCE